MKESPSHETARRTTKKSDPGSRAIVEEGDLPVAVVPKKPRRFLMIGVGAAVAIGAFLSFRRATEKPPIAPPPPAVSMDGGRIRFTEEFATRHKITEAKATLAPLSPTLQVTGTIRHDVRKFAALGARSAGRVRRVMKIMGDEVKVGDILADIESVDLGRAQASAEGLRAKELAALSNLVREEQLTQAKVTAAREAEQAKAEHKALLAERKAAEKTVAALGAGLDSEVGILKLRSPIAGKVILAKASRGQTVEPSDTLFEVADLSSVWAELAVFERDLARLGEGDTVEILPAGSEVAPLVGTIAKIGSLIDPNTRTAVVRVDVDNRKGLLRPGQSIAARIKAKDSGVSVLVVPKSALTFVDGKPTVLVLVAPGLVEPRPVGLGPDDGAQVSIHTGLQVGDAVIAKGLFALKSEIFR